MTLTTAEALSPGEGSVVFTRVRERTVVESARATSPLKLLTPSNHGHAAWMYVASFGGGLVDGDAISLDLRVRANASAMLATQASTKVYRSRGDDSVPGSAQRLSAHVEKGALLALLPDPVTCFAGARYRQTIRVHLEDGATLVLLDALTCGRRAYGEEWAFERYASRIEITRGETARPALIDSLLLDPAHGAIAQRMAGFDALATLVAIGPRATEVRAALVAAHGRGVNVSKLTISPVIAANALGGDANDSAIARIAGESVEDVTLAARELLAALATELGDDPFARKW